MKKIMTATEFRKELFNVIKHLQKSDNEITITVDGQPSLVVMSFEKYDGLIETLDIMSNPQMVKDIEEGIKDIEEGRIVSWEELRKTHNIKNEDL